jgi:hypothetical protein
VTKIPDGSIYLENAVQSSNLAFGAVMMLVKEAEDMFNMGEISHILLLCSSFHSLLGVPSDKRPTTYPAWRAYNTENFFSLVITSPFVFANVPSAANAIPTISRDSLSSKSVFVLLNNALLITENSAKIYPL